MIDPRPVASPLRPSPNGYIVFQNGAATACLYQPDYYSRLDVLPPADLSADIGEPRGSRPAICADGITERFSLRTSRRHQPKELHLRRIVENTRPLTVDAAEVSPLGCFLR